MDNIKKLRLEKGYNMKQAALALNLPYTTYVSYEKGDREPNSDVLVKIADFYNTTVDYVLAVSSVRNPTMNVNIPDGFLPPPQTVKRPRLGVISCGEPIMSEENFDGYDDVPENIHCDFTLVCEGDSMVGARILDGDIVYIKQQSTIENGQIAAVLVDGCEKLLKRVYISEDSIILQAENPNYSPISFFKEDMNRVSIIGKAAGFFSPIK